MAPPDSVSPDPADLSDLAGFCAVVLAGGRGSRLGGVDKAGVELRGRTLLDHALDAVLDAAEVVVVGDPVPTERPVTFTREDPRHGGPVAGLLTGVDALLRRPRTIGVLAVDMPRVSWRTFRRLHEAAHGRDGAFLVGDDGRRQLAGVLRADALHGVRPSREGQHGMAVRDLLARLDLADVPAEAGEHRDVDTWADLRDLAEETADDTTTHTAHTTTHTTGDTPGGLATGPATEKPGAP